MLSATAARKDSCFQRRDRDGLVLSTTPIRAFGDTVFVLLTTPIRAFDDRNESLVFAIRTLAAALSAADQSWSGSNPDAGYDGTPATAASGCSRGAIYELEREAWNGVLIGYSLQFIAEMSY